VNRVLPVSRDQIGETVEGFRDGKLGE